MIFGISSSSFQYEENCKNSHLFSENKIGTNHKKNWKKDFQLLKDLKVKNYRFSIEWSEIEPKEGVYDEETIQRYHKYIDWLKKENIVPIICLFHFSLPKWFHKKGGFLKIPEKFELFCIKMIEEYDLKHFIIYNEPNVYSVCCYLLGRWKPCQKNYFKYSKCIKNMTTVYNSIVLKYPQKKIGIIINIIPSVSGETFLNNIFDSINITSNVTEI